MGQSLQNLTFTELSKSSVFVVKSLAPPPLPLLVGVLIQQAPLLVVAGMPLLLGLRLTHIVVDHAEMWWLLGCAPDFWGKGPGFESDISHNDPDGLQDHCVL